MLRASPMLVHSCADPLKPVRHVERIFEVVSGFSRVTAASDSDR